MAAMFVAALCFSSCDHNNGEGGNGGGGNHEYPATANVIRNAVKDIDGNKYDAVRIGDQVWMAENLKTTRYADGTTIPLGENNVCSKTQPYRYYPDNIQGNKGNEIYVKNYGYLYNWAAVMHGASSSNANPSGVQGICPNGWHVPSESEWTQLITYMKSEPMYMSSGNSNFIAKALSATWGWQSYSNQNYSHYQDTPGYDPTTNNASGFSAVPAGYFCSEGSFDVSRYAYFYGSTERYSIDIDYGRAVVYDDTYSYIDNGYSVRCVKD